MSTKAIQLPNREAQRMKSYREELLERIARAAPEDGLVEPFAELRLYRASSPTEPLPSVSDPTFCVIAQGSKADSCFMKVWTRQAPVSRSATTILHTSIASTRSSSGSRRFAMSSGCAGTMGNDLAAIQSEEFAPLERANN